MLCGIWGRDVGCHCISSARDLGFCGIGFGLPRVFACTQSMRGVVCVKIVVVRSPKMFRGILRRMFGIKREDYIE